MRKPYIDNIRCGIVLLVILYHVFYIFNSVGVISNVAVTGTPAFDVMLYIPYPWFMAVLFLLSGISARYALSAMDAKTFLKKRVRKILVPSLAGIFLIGWVGGFITSRYTDIFGGNGAQIPGLIKFFIYCLSGIGPLWFLHELFFCTLILLLLRKLDKKDRLWQLGGRCSKIRMLALLFPAVWFSSYCLNTPLIEVYRNGFYLAFFLIGYYVFSHEEAQQEAERFWLPLLVAAVALGIAYTVFFWGENYASLDNLKHPLTNAYAWFGSMALIGVGRRWCNYETGFTRYMRSRSFGFYVLHYYLLILITYVVDLRFELKFPLFYLILTALTAVLLPLLYEALSRIPVLKRLLLGE
ncbi:MAG: acyltransferase [Acetatifactor sp.]